MAYLRSIVGLHAKRVHRARCTHCDTVVYRFERFCPACGSRNQRFDAAVFTRFAKSSIEQAATICAKDTEHVVEAGEEYPLKRSRHTLPFCSVCGLRIPKDSLIDDWS